MEAELDVEKFLDWFSEKLHEKQDSLCHDP
jgi:hypothetical protein